MCGVRFANFTIGFDVSGPFHVNHRLLAFIYIDDLHKRIIVFKQSPIQMSLVMSVLLETVSGVIAHPL
jgi:hypothetical protein